MTTRQRFGSDLIATGMTHDSMGFPIDPGAIYDCREDGRVSPEQAAWHDRLRKNGWRVDVCRSLDEVLAVLRECYPDKIK